jgi:pyridoxine 5-phosphate synthase
LYTEHYAKQYSLNKGGEAIEAYIAAAAMARDCSLGVNAGHDLDLHNLHFFCKSIPWLQEVSIGHALICDALYLGLSNTIQLYKRQLLVV